MSNLLDNIREHAEGITLTNIRSLTVRIQSSIISISIFALVSLLSFLAHLDAENRPQ